MKQFKFINKVMLIIVTLLTMFSTNAWGTEGDELAVCQGTGSGYGVRRTLTDSHSVGWVLSTGQSGYLGTNSATNHNKVKPTAADLPVVKAQNASATTSTTGYYFYYTSTAISNVGSIVFSYTANSGNSSATAYVVYSSTAASSGSATWSKPTLASGSGLSAQGVSLGTSGTFTFKLSATETSAKYYGIIIVTASTKRMTAGTITIKEGATGGSDPTITTSVSTLSNIGYSTVDFSRVIGTFTVSGSNLTANVTVTAPTNYEVCKTENGTYTSSITFNKGSGTLSASNVYVRPVTGLAAGSYGGKVACASTGATTQNVNTTGNVPFTVTWQANGSTFSTTYVPYGTNPGSNLGTIPGDPGVSCGGKAFYGWYDGVSYEHASTPPSIVTSTTKITTDKTYNAVFATQSGDPTSVTSFATGSYYLVAKYSSSYYAMSGSETGGITAVDVTSSVTYNSTPKTITVSSSAFTSDMVYAISGTTSAATITQGGTVVGNSSSGDFNRSGTWVVSDVSSDKTFQFSGNSRCIMFRSTPIFKNYSTSNAGSSGYGDGYLYLVPVPTYTNFSTTCAACSETPSITGVSLTGSAFSTTSVPVQATGVSAGTNCSLSSYGFYWGTSASPSGNSTASNNLSAGTFSATLTGPFTIGTQYYYRAWATNNGENTGYSSDGTFTLQNVTFNMHGHGGDAPATQVVPQGGKATDPGDPSAAGYTFDGWWDNSSYTGSAWDFSTNTVGSGGVTLHAKWTEKPKYTITLNAGNGTVSADGWTAGASPTWSKTQANGDESITLPSASCNCAGWEFQGWAASSVDQVAAPSMTSSGASVLPASNTTYYAVYRQNATGGTTYNKITSTGDLTTGDYLFVSTYNAAMENEVSSAHTTEETSGFSSSASSITTSNTNVIWTIVKFGSQVVIKNGSNFLGVNESNEICLTTTPHLFTYSYTSTYWVFTSVSKPSYQLMYGGSPSYFRMGTAQGGTYVIYLYKQGAGMTGNYKTNPSCSDLTITGVANPVAGGTVTLSATSAKEGDKVYAICTPDAEYNFTNWSISGTSVSPTSATTQFVEITVGSGNVTATANFSAKVMYDVTWKANGSTLTGGDLGSASTRVENGHNITTLPPTPTSCETGDGKSENFIGWVVDAQNWSGKTNDLTSITIYKKASDFPAVSGNVTYHAVWAATDETKNEWVKVTAVADVEAGFKYAVISYDDAYYVKNTDQTTNKPSVYSVNKTAGDINFTSDMEFNVTAGPNDGFIFTSASVANVKIWGGTANDGVRVNTNADTYDEWFVELNATYGVIMTATSSKYLSTYGTQDWRNYVEGTLSSTNRPANLYKYALGYKNYMTSCCTANDITLNGSGTVSGGTFSADASSACEGATITLSTSICSGYTVGDWDVYKTGESSTKVSVTDNAFTMPAYGVTVALSTTIRQDHYIDKLHNSTGYTGTGALREGCSYSVPDDISNTTPGSGCENEHYVFVGWVDAGHVAADGSLLSGYSLFKGGTKDASGTTYYAIWAKDIE